jgi:hypothetical protein
MRKDHRFDFRFLSSVAVLSLASSAATSATIFTDSFENGSLASAQNGASWGGSRDTAISTSRYFSGQSSLQFTFEAGPLGDDAFSEQRINLPRRSAYWFHYKLFIPSNYHHRSDGASNNKFLAVYRAPYQTPGYQVNFSLQPNGAGGSNLDIHHYRNGSEQKVRRVATNFITDADRGKWMDVIAEIRVPSSSTAYDGVMRLTKNGSVVASVTDLGAWGGTDANYIDQAYFLGWSNSGFNDTTVMYIDDVVISDTPIGAVVPRAPTNVNAQ